MWTLSTGSPVFLKARWRTRSVDVVLCVSIRLCCRSGVKTPVDLVYMYALCYISLNGDSSLSVCLSVSYTCCWIKFPLLILGGFIDCVRWEILCMHCSTQFWQLHSVLKGNHYTDSPITTKIIIQIASDLLSVRTNFLPIYQIFMERMLYKQFSDLKRFDLKILITSDSLLL